MLALPAVSSGLCAPLLYLLDCLADQCTVLCWSAPACLHQQASSSMSHPLPSVGASRQLQCWQVPSTCVVLQRQLSAPGLAMTSMPLPAAPHDFTRELPVTSAPPAAAPLQVWLATFAVGLLYPASRSVAALEVFSPMEAARWVGGWGLGSA